MKKATFFLLGFLTVVLAQPSWNHLGFGFIPSSVEPLNISIVDSNTYWVSGRNTNACRVYLKVVNGIPSTGTVNTIQTSESIANIYGVSSDSAWVLTYDANDDIGGGLYLKEPGFSTWTNKLLANGFLNTIHFFDKNEGIILGDPDSTGNFEIYTTQNKGTTWHRLPSANIPYPPGSGHVGYVNVANAKGDSIWFATKQYVFRSIDRGQHWTYSNSSTSLGAAPVSIAFKNSLEGVVLYEYNIIHQTMDGGDTWTERRLDTNIPQINSIAYIDSSNKLLGASVYSNGGIFLIDSVSGIKQYPNASSRIAVVNDHTIYSYDVSNANPGMLKYSFSTATSINTKPDFLLNAYPNPMNNWVTIDALLEKEGVKIELFDLYGKMIYSYSNSFTHDLHHSINVNSLPTGLYNLVVSTDKSSKSLKLTKQ